MNEKVEFYVFDDGKNKPIPPKRVYFRLEEYYGGVQLVACNENGSFISYVFLVQKNGTGIRPESVSDKTGLQLDEDGRIVLDE